MTESSPAHSLATMKRIALGLLVAAAALYAVATAMEARHPAWSYVAAFAEAAMVGAVADWFAVVALFRHPLGLPIPHTAIIPRNKTRIGRNLAAFICDHFLSTAQVLDKIRTVNPAQRVATWMAKPAHAARLARYATVGLRYALHAFDDRRVQHFIQQSVLQRLAAVDVAPLAGQVLDVLTAEGRHQSLLDDVLQLLAQRLDDDQVQALITERVASELSYLRYVGLDNVAARATTRKLVASFAGLLGELGDDPHHPLRQRFDAFMAGFITRLKSDPALRDKGEALKQQVLSHPALTSYVLDLWCELRDWLHDDLNADNSHLHMRVSHIVQALGDKLSHDAAMQQWLNEQLLLAAPPLIERYRDDIRGYIEQRVAQWDTQDMTRELELNIGRDLQFVRVNGTLVGGLVGLLIHTITHALR